MIPHLILQLEPPLPGDTGIWLAILDGIAPLPRLVDGLCAEFPYVGAKVSFPGQLARFHHSRVVRWLRSVCEFAEHTPEDRPELAGLLIAARLMERHIGIKHIEGACRYCDQPERDHSRVHNFCPNVSGQQYREHLTPAEQVEFAAVEVER